MLAGIPSFQLDRLPAVMNAAARLVFQTTETSRYNHITLRTKPVSVACTGFVVSVCKGSEMLRLSYTLDLM